MPGLHSGILLLITFLAGANGGADADVGGLGTRTNNPDQLQDDILAAMKDSGVLDEWKEKLDDMLYNDKEDDDSQKKEKKKLPVINDQEREMLRSFIDEYKSDGNLKISTELILNIVERVQKTPKPNLPQIFVQLGPVIDVVDAIAGKAGDVEKIIARQSPIFDSPAKPKDILHTLTENLKSELSRLKTPGKAPKPEKKRKQQQPGGGAGGLGLSDYLTLGSTLLKGGNGGEILSLLSGEADFSSVLKLLPKLVEQGDYKPLLGRFISSYVSSNPLLAMGQTYLSTLIDSEQGENFMKGFFSTFEEFVTSTNFEKLVNLIPKINKAKNMEEVLVLMTKEAETNWDSFFSSITNEDYKTQTIDSFSSTIVQGFDFFNGIERGSVLSQVPLLVNGFLVSYKLPRFDPKNAMGSLTKIVSKAVQTYGGMKNLDIAPYIESATEALNQAYQAQAKGNAFSKLSSTEKQALITRMLDQEVISPLQTVWTAFSRSKAEPQCSEHLMCLVMMREVKTSANPARVAVTQGSSLVASWALSENSKEKYWKLYKAVWTGGRGEDCSVQFPVTGKVCDVFSWQKKQMMNTQYDHVEL